MSNIFESQVFATIYGAPFSVWINQDPEVVGLGLFATNLLVWFMVVPYVCNLSFSPVRGAVLLCGCLFGLMALALPDSSKENIAYSSFCMDIATFVYLVACIISDILFHIRERYYCQIKYAFAQLVARRFENLKEERQVEIQV